MGEQPAVNVLESLQLLRNENPIERKRGIMALSAMIDDSRVLRVFEHLYENDPDAGVRQMAWRAINRQGASIPAPGPVAPPTVAVPLSTPPAAPPSHSAAQQEPFLINPANVRLLAAHARAQTPRRGGMAFFLAAVLLLIAGIVWGWVLPGWIDQLQLDRSGVTAAGEIIRLYVQSDDGSAHYYASYRFPVDSESGDPLIMRTEQRITRSAYNGLSTNSPVDVTYLPGEPDRVRLMGVSTPAEEQRRSLTVVAVGLSGAVLLLLLVGLVRRGRPSRIKGRILWGEVVRATGELDARGRYTVRLRYQFRVPQGKKMLVKQTSRARSDLDPEDIPGSGTPVMVYYRSKKDHRLL